MNILLYNLVGRHYRSQNRERQIFYSTKLSFCSTYLFIKLICENVNSSMNDYINKFVLQNEKNKHNQ